MSKGKPIYAALPARTIGDERLTALDLRVLMVIAVHDRLGANGVGCYASHTRLATLVRCHLKSLSRSLRTLGECGYIEGKPNPLNKRLRVYQVVYRGEDGEYLKTATTSIGNEPATYDQPIGNEVATDQPSIGNQDFENIEQDQGDAEINIFCEAGNTSGETFKIHPVETASLSRRDASEECKQENVGGNLARLERALKAGKLNQDDAESWCDYCEHVMETSDCGDPNYGRASRLLAEIDDRLPF